MTISIWRYSHLILAVSSSIFILVASITGIVLAFEPISNQLKPYAIHNANEITLAETLSVLQQEYAEVLTIEIDNNDFVIVSATTKNGENDTFYANPKTGKKLGNLIKKEPVFEFAQNLHRSLFLKSTGRFIVGLFSFLLFLIALTGIKLILKIQGGFKQFFSKVVKENFQQYYHVVIGRYALIPIIIITITGVYLSLEKFGALPSHNIKHEVFDVNSVSEKMNIQDFEVFNTITLDQLKFIEFPFSDDEEDYFILELKDKKLYINQYTGALISKAEKPLVALASHWSMILHTGQGNTLWSVVLLLSCFAILFFMYSGFAMTLKRKKKTSKIKNIFKKDEAIYILLVGSESGHTYSFAKRFFDALIKQGCSVYIDALNNYTTYKEAKQLIIFTSTYGEGEAPVNANKFEKLVLKINQNKALSYSVLGFGSLAYSGFCKYAIQVDALMQNHPSFTPNLTLHKINNQSFEAFENWIQEWNSSTELSLNIDKSKLQKNKADTIFEVIERSAINQDESFVLRLKPNKKIPFTSGDLLSIYPENDFLVERLYSIANLNNDVVLSIKKHEYGICSNYLSQLKENDMIKATIKQNHEFHFPKKAKEVVMIANGTGIAPFLGMINENSNHIKNIRTHLFWGARTQDSLSVYSKYIDSAYNNKTLSNFHIAYSQEQENKIYVQDLILKKADLISDILKNKGVIMICGSVVMQNKVLEILESITKLKLNKPLSVFEDNNQIKKYCY